MTLFQFWHAQDCCIPIALIYTSESEWEIDSTWVWEGTPEELYSEYGYKMYEYEIIEIQREDSGYTLWITEKEN